MQGADPGMDQKVRVLALQLVPIAASSSCCPVGGSITDRFRFLRRYCIFWLSIIAVFFSF